MHEKLFFTSFFAAALLVACTTEEDLGRRADGGDGTSQGDSQSNGTGGSDGSTSGVCEGDPPPCKDTSDETTCTKRGCTYAPPACTGEARDCSTLSQATCDYVPGCQWTLLFGSYTCAGRAVACDERVLTGNCDPVLGKSGCVETGGCSGTPAACSTYDARGCSHPGCSYRPY